MATSITRGLEDMSELTDARRPTLRKIRGYFFRSEEQVSSVADWVPFVWMSDVMDLNSVGGRPFLLEVPVAICSIAAASDSRQELSHQ